MDACAISFETKCIVRYLLAGDQLCGERRKRAIKLYFHTFSNFLLNYNHSFSSVSLPSAVCLRLKSDCKVTFNHESIIVKSYIFFKIYLFYLKVTITGTVGESEKERKLFQPLAHCPNGHNDQGWVSLKLGARSFSCVSHIDARAQQLEMPFSADFQGQQQEDV